MSNPSRSTLSFFEKINHDMDELKTIPFNPTRLKQWNGALNMQRISTRFTLLTEKQVLTLAQQNHLLDKLHHLLGITINVAVLDAPLGVYNALSVALPLSRFLFNIGLAVQRALSADTPSDALSLFEHSIQDNHVEIVNDAVWALVNGLSNYASYFNLSPMTANVLTGIFLVFDIVWLKHVLTLAEEQYEKNKSLALADNNMNELLRLESNIVNTRAKLYFCMIAGSLLVTGFGLAVLASSQVLVPLCFFICNIGIAMYLTSGQYGTYQEKNTLFLTLDDNLDDRNDLRYLDAQRERDNAWTNLTQTMLKNTVMPFILISAFTLNVPAAIVLTLAYIASEQGVMSYASDLMSSVDEKTTELRL
jgi:hypothetical protein